MSYPAAFRRLCVETWASVGEELGKYQPPSGGCVLKHGFWAVHQEKQRAQPPSGGCVLKPAIACLSKLIEMAQPPSGGCVLKLIIFAQCFHLFTSRLQAAVC